MNPYYESGPVTLYHGDCLAVMRELPDASVDAVVTDPPYGLEFMGKEWDGADGFRRSLNAADAGRESVFGRTSRTSPEYRTAGAGFSKGGFATSNGYSKRETPAYGKTWTNKRCTKCGHISSGGSPCVCPDPEWVVEHGDIAAPGRTFQAWSEVWAEEAFRLLKPGGFLLSFGGSRTWHRLAVAVEDAGFEIRDSIAWLYGSGFPKHPNVLKPAFEPIVVARKPMIGTLAVNVDAHGTGALNIDANRIEGRERTDYGLANAKRTQGAVYGEPNASADFDASKGRWPTNVLVEQSQADELDRQSGVTQSRIGKPRGASAGEGWGMTQTGTEYSDEGGASRFFPTFHYEAKAGSSERPGVDGVLHPTVKPLALMQWLVRLVTPPNGTVLEPFAGSGTTAEACMREGFNCIAIERDEAYLPLILQRLAKPHEQTLDLGDIA